ncbi:MAG: methyl-accepting chemotaxis protein [Defluviitaleaceae bacterium]|nr:methyl-accepting chemotaxis protein [Defluviitaleaceae bacterium]
MEQTKNHTAKPQLLIQIISIIVGAIALSTIVAIISTPLVGAIVSIVVAVIVIVILYAIMNRAISNSRHISDAHHRNNIKAIINEINRVEKAIGGTDWYARGDKTVVGDEGKTIIEGLNRVVDTVFNYLYNVPCVISVFDDKARFIYTNKLCQEQGFDPKIVLGKTVYEVSPDATTKLIVENAEKVVQIGKEIHFQASFTSPTGQELVEEHIDYPIKDAGGNVSSVIIVNFDVTDIVRMTRQAEKISIYQDVEAENIIAKLSEGLDKGFLQFRYEPEPHDKDTAVAASAYKKIGDTMQHVVAFIKGYIDEINDILSAIAVGNLTLTITREYLGDFDSIKHSVNSIVARLNETVVDISLVADGVSSGSTQLSQSSMNLSEGVSQQMLSMQEMTEGIGLVDEGAKGNSDNAQKAADLALTSRGNAEAGNSEMKKLLDAMEKINVSSTEISKIVSTIEGIAFQTNLLALNAAVEAARAGEHGKGFNVVAEEVRSLAGRSAEAAKQTVNLIQESIENVQDGKKAAIDTAESLEKIVQNVLDVSDVIHEIYESSAGQTGAIGNINNDLRQISRVVQASAATSEETAAAAEELDSQVAILKNKLSFFSTNLATLSVKKVWDATTSDRINAASLKNVQGDHKKFATGDVIIKEGDVSTDTMYFVLEGSVKVVKSYETLNEKLLAILKAGDLFGEMALFLKEPRTAYVVALSNVTVVEIHRSTLAQFMESSPEAANAIIETLCKRLKNVLADLESY